MSTRYWNGKTVNNPRGAWPTTALVRAGNPSRGNVSNNVRFSPGRVAQREGTSAVFASADKVTGMYNWLAPYSVYTTTAQNLVLYQDGTAIKRRRLSDSSTVTLLSSLGGMRAPSFAELGPRVYFCGFDTGGTGTIQCRIHDGVITTGVPNVDVAFRGPLTVSAFSAADNGVGQCTAGTHYLAFVYQSRSGFSGQPSPVNGSAIFSPTSVTLNAGLRTIRMSVTLNTPSDAGLGSAVFPIMTRADNPNKWFFVPPAFYTPEPWQFPISTNGWSQNVDISISDEDLATSATPADDQFNLLVAGASSGPFNPNFVASYGRRMMYGAGTQVYGSEIDNPQAITADFSQISLPSQRQVAFGFQLGQDFFLTGDKWTGRTRDNSDSPATWEQASLISDSLGAPFPGCVTNFGDGLIKKWIATEAGLYLFNGAFPSHPVTFFWSTDWARINWTAAYAIEMADDPTSLRTYVGVPLDGATECTHMFCIDYTNGETFDTCDVSLDNYPANVSSLAMVKEYSTARSNLWIGPSAAGNVVHLDTSVHDDVGTAIHSIWETGYIRQPGEMQSQTIRVGAMNLWMRGGGTAPTLTWYGLDRTQSVTPVLLSQGNTQVTTLTNAPGLIYLAKGDLSPVENYTLRIDSNTTGAWWELSGIVGFARPSLYNR